MIGGEWKRAGGIDKAPFFLGSGCITLSLGSYRAHIVSFSSTLQQRIGTSTSANYDQLLRRASWRRMKIR
jgi:hypothetical protein